MPIIHETLGLIDMRSFTTFGVNAKPGVEAPIGYFGTGLKYALAVLLREGLSVTVWVGREPHVFYGDPVSFRVRDLTQIRMRRQRGATARWMSTELPFTTELGKNWELWMALRELHSNTLDEGGTTRAVEVAPREGVSGATRIVVEGPAYEEAHARIDDVFLPDADRSCVTTQILPRPSQHVYYRGLRAHSLERPSLLTYVVWSALELTEDRTVKHGYMVDYYVRREIMRQTDERLLRRVVEADDDTYEGQINWQAGEREYATPEFLHVVQLYGDDRVRVVYLEKKPKVERTRLADWREELIMMLRSPDDVSEREVGEYARAHAESLIAALRAHRFSSGGVVGGSGDHPMTARLEDPADDNPESQDVDPAAEEEDLLW